MLIVVLKHFFVIWIVSIKNEKKTVKKIFLQCKCPITPLHGTEEKASL